MIAEPLRSVINLVRGKSAARARAVLRKKFPEADERDLQRLEFVEPFTMTSPERLWALRRAIKYIVERGVPGDIAETGVWRGGSSMMSAYSLLDAGEAARTIWLFDTFEGMPAPTDADVKLRTGALARERFEAERLSADSSKWCNISLPQVRANMASTGYPATLVRYVVGKTQDVLRDTANHPEQLALLRLDTDWYESTKAELEHLFDKLSPGGVLIIDDYGDWAGSMRATDEFLAKQSSRYFLQRIDYAGRAMVKL